MRSKKLNDFKILKDYAIMFVKHKNIVLEVMLDKEDIYSVISVGAWHAIYDKTLQNPSYYIAHRYNNKTIGKGVIKLHRYVTNCPKDKEIDHINHDTLDNRKENLKICTRFENQQNLRSCRTGVTGVFYSKSKNKWVSSISKNNKRYQHEFKTFEQALESRNNMMKILYGGDANNG